MLQRFVYFAGNLFATKLTKWLSFFPLSLLSWFIYKFLFLIFITLISESPCTIQYWTSLKYHVPFYITLTIISKIFVTWWLSWTQSKYSNWSPLLPGWVSRWWNTDVNILEHTQVGSVWLLLLFEMMLCFGCGPKLWSATWHLLSSVKLLTIQTWRSWSNTT